MWRFGKFDIQGVLLQLQEHHPHTVEDAMPVEAARYQSDNKSSLKYLCKKYNLNQEGVHYD